MLKDKTILITGSASGIGAETARLAVRYGAKVILHDRTADTKLKAITDELVMPHVVCDITDASAVREVVNEAISAHGPIHGLVTCAGINLIKKFEETSEEDWLNAYKTNFLGTAYFAKELFPHMKSSGCGHAVFISSIRALRTHTSGSRAAYSASKAAIINLTESLAKDYAPNITVNCVIPGFIDTGMARDWTKETRKEIEKTPMKRPGTAEETAELICFLLGEKASYITGESITIDGGASLGSH